MEFDILSYGSQAQSDNETTVSNLLSKTKSPPTKFISELNRHQKIGTKKKVLPSDNLKRNTVGKKRKKGIPTFRDMILSSKSNHTLEEKQQPTKTTEQTKVQSKKIVHFSRPEIFNCVEKKQKKRTSIQQAANFNFYETIKQMAVNLSDQKKNNPFDKSQNSLRQISNDQDLFTGYTEREFQDGVKFKGICQNGVILRGQLHFKNGFIYDGEIFLDKFHGKGKLILPKGQTIEADWIEGEIVGKATIKYPKGQIFYGEVKNFKRHGQGYLFFNDGSKYEGEFNQGELTGYGVHTTVQNQKTTGYWFYGDYIGADEQIFENVVNNTAAHEQKKAQKKSRNMRISKIKHSTSRNSENLFADLFLNLEKITQCTKTESTQE